jgi:hypothetical protein
MSTLLADAFASLAALELITKPQRLAVEQHPARSAFLALHDPVRQLVWMHEHKILSEDALDDMMSFDAAPPEREAILQAAMLEIERANDVRNGRLLDSLLRDGLITPTQHAAARHDPSGLYHESAADLLYSLILFDTVSTLDFDATRQRTRANAGNNDGLRRLRIVDDVQSRLTALKDARRHDAPTLRPYTDPTRARRLGWFYLTSLTLFIAAITWLLLR